VDEELQVLAVGDEPRVSFNPLILPAAIEADLWDRAFADVFIRAYGLSEPSRRILLDCLWALREGSKGSPTLRELENAVGEFKTESSKEQGSKRSLESRLHVINMGTVGRSLNSEKALDFGAMEDRVTVFEVGQVGSLRDQRFLAELMLAQLWHFDTARAIREDVEDELRRLIVIEEAHRYLSEERPPQQRGDRTLLELAIAEARKCGWGFLIVDQMPTLLSRYVWENCGTVLAHRLTNLDSYEVVRSALGGGPLTADNDVVGDPTALRLPEDIAMFRRYVDPGFVKAGTGFVLVPRVGRAKAPTDGAGQQ
jgi:DNA helicase HerA-like ATPase